jgi:DNA-binding response OmpR family regulator
MKVLFVQEQTFLATALRLTLLTKGYDLVVSDDWHSASSLIEAHNPNIVIADISKTSGLLYVEEAKRKNVPVIVISKNGQEDELQKAFDKGADDYISMPLSINELALRVSILTKSRAVA